MQLLDSRVTIFTYRALYTHPQTPISACTHKCMGVYLFLCMWQWQHFSSFGFLFCFCKSSGPDSIVSSDYFLSMLKRPTKWGHGQSYLQIPQPLQWYCFLDVCNKQKQRSDQSSNWISSVQTSYVLTAGINKTMQQGKNSKSLFGNFLSPKIMNETYA